MTIAFDKAFLRILTEEGGYINDPLDPGGETKFGISKRSYPDLDILNLTQDDAKAIYLKDYWTPIQGDKLPVPIALIVFDGAVNQGLVRVVQALQQALHVEPDGIIGSITLSAIPRFNTKSLCIELLASRACLYLASPNKERFFKGWMKRLFDLSADVI